MRWLSLFAILSGLAIFPARGEETLTIYTYDSFVGEWGPGPALTEAYQAQCACRIDWQTVEDGAALLARLKLEGRTTRADLILGLDGHLMAEAEATGLIAPHGLNLPPLALPIAWPDKDFVPFDWGYFAFVYDRQSLPKAPTSLAELADGKTEPKIIIEDPRSSTPGLGLLAWIRLAYGDRAPEIWAGLKPKILTVAKGWGEAYGLFLKGEAPLVLSYTTSPAYHAIVEKSDRYPAALFTEGHLLQIELAALTIKAAGNDQARQFLAFLLTPKAQKIIATANYMYPAIDLGPDLPPEFSALPKPEKTLVLPPEDAKTHREAWIAEWLDILAR